ncbi:unnamed protein product, partial [Candida parapsilosis]
GSKL